MTAPASKVQIVCTGRGSHPQRSIGWLDLAQQRGTRLLRGLTSRWLVEDDDDRTFLPYADATVVENARGGWTYHLKCPACGRENRLPDISVVRFVVAQPGQRVGGMDGATRLDISQI